MPLPLGQAQFLPLVVRQHCRQSFVEPPHDRIIDTALRSPVRLQPLRQGAAHLEGAGLSLQEVSLQQIQRTTWAILRYPFCALLHVKGVSFGIARPA
eukprot:3087541-Rhodomonas_salina.1